MLIVVSKHPAPSFLIQKICSFRGTLAFTKHFWKLSFVFTRVGCLANKIPLHFCFERMSNWRVQRHIYDKVNIYEGAFYKQRQLKAVNYFRKKASSQTCDRVLNKISGKPLANFQLRKRILSKFGSEQIKQMCFSFFPLFN